MKKYSLTIVALIILVVCGKLTAQNKNIEIWNSNESSFVAEYINAQKAVLFDSIGVWEKLGPYDNDILHFDFGNNNDSIIYAGSREAGVFKTFDGGENWQQINNGITGYFIRALAVNPLDRNQVLAGTYNDGLFRSTDGGNTWSHVDEIDDNTIFDIRFNPNSGDTVYVGTMVKGVFRSWNAGLDWEHITAENEVIALTMLVDPSSSNMVYFASMDSVFQSKDYGNTWNSFFASPEGTTVLSLAIDPDNSNTIFIGTHNTLNKTIDGGLNWDILIHSPNVIVEDIIINSNNTDEIYLASPWPGVYKSEDGGNNWVLLDNGGEGIIAISIKFHPQSNDIIYVGTNENALLRTGYSLTSYFTTSIGDDLYLSCYPNPFSENTTIEYNIPEKFDAKEVQFVIYDETGNLVGKNMLFPNPVGLNTFDFNRTRLSSGVYYYGVKFGNKTRLNKMIVVD